MPEVTCIHCGLPVPAGLIDENAEHQFCCNGCKMVYETIHGCGLQRFYDLKDEDDETIPGRATGGGYELFDDPAFQQQHVRGMGDGLKTTDLYLEGVHCAACVWLVEKLPTVLTGVVETRLDIRRKVASVVWDDETVKLSRLARTLDSLGYPPHPFRAVQGMPGGGMQDIWRREQHKHLIRIGVAGACAMNVMVIAFALYGGMFTGIEEEYRTLFNWSALGITLIALLVPGRTFFVGALSSLRARALHMDVPIALALTVGTVWGAIATIRGGQSEVYGDVYFESLTAVIFLLLLGRWVQHRQQHMANDAIELLYCLTPMTARLVDADGSVREVAIDSLDEGALIEIRAGDVAPADGVIVEGESTFDLSLLTGESRPVSMRGGETVHAGAVNISSRIVASVTATGMETRVGRLMALIERYAQERPPIVRLADRVAHYFVIVVLSLAVIAAGIWLWIEPAAAVRNAVALLIVSCPCALGLATPLAVVAAIGQAAKEGILIKGGEVMERLSTPGRIILDKTGTLTQGSMTVETYVGDEQIKPMIAAVETQVVHPIATALVKATMIEGGELPPATIESVAGGGVVGRVAIDGGREVVVGSSSFARERLGDPPAWVVEAERAALNQAQTVVLIGADGDYAAVIGLGDPVLDETPDTIRQLKDAGWEVGILSGDHPEVVEAVARKVGVDAANCQGGASPERKAEVVADAASHVSTVVMVGDGVNDAAALSAAGVGVAVHGGAEASLAAADVFLSKPGVRPIVELIEGSRRTVGIIKRNLGVSLFYNVIAASLALAGVINPLIAAILMPISSLTVVTLSYRSRSFGT